MIDMLRRTFRSVIGFLLRLEAQAVFRKYRPKIALIAGGVGKTLGSRGVYAALSGTRFVRRSGKGGPVGASLAILGVSGDGSWRWPRDLLEGLLLSLMRTSYPDWLVLEAGADRPGDITKRLSWIRPDVVVAARFPAIPAHVEFFPSPQAVAEEELAPVGWLREGGTLVANADDAVARDAVAPPGVRRLTYGFGDDADLRGVGLHTAARGGMAYGISFEVRRGEERARVSLSGVMGEQHAYPILAGVAVALSAGVPLAAAAEACEAYEPPPGRMRLIRGMRDSVVVDDSYNASPAAAEEALFALRDAPHTGKRVAILADMLELGAFSMREHVRIGNVAAHAADLLVTVGVRARDIARGAREAGMEAERVLECETGADAAARLLPIVGEGDIVLVKGSQAMRMERMVKALMADPKQAPALLARQSREWLRRP